MGSIAKLVLLFGLGALLAAGAAAQVRYFHPEKYERATTTDDDGLTQWAEHPEIKCRTCKGTGKMECKTCERYPDEAEHCPDCGRKDKKQAVCHACAGEGKFLDPLEKALCPGCQGAGYVMCGCCPGSGLLKLGDNAKRWSNCIGCRGDGSFKCLVCKGKRTVPVAKLKPSLKQADAATLQQALETTDKMLADLGAFSATPKKARKDEKKLGKIFKQGEKLYPPLKVMPKQLKTLMKWTYAGSSYQGQEERETQSLTRIKKSCEYFLQHQKRILGLALKRAEANEKLAAGK